VGTFLGDANVVPGDVRSGLLHCEVGTAPVEASDGPVWALVRPEDLDLDEHGGDATVLEVEYFGHDQVITVALPSGLEVRARLHARRRFDAGTRVGVIVGGLGVATFPRPPGSSLRTR
jgi:iron(III) transport system ATP-binding protein